MKMILYTLKKIKAGRIDGEPEEIVAQSGLLKLMLNHDILQPMSIAEFHAQRPPVFGKEPKILIDSRIINFDIWFDNVKSGILNKGLSNYKIAEYHFAILNVLDAHLGGHQERWLLVSYAIYASAVEMPDTNPTGILHDE